MLSYAFLPDLVDNALKPFGDVMAASVDTHRKSEFDRRPTGINDRGMMLGRQADSVFAHVWLQSLG